MHRIRLHGPWDVTGPGETVPRSEKMPQDWRALFGEKPGIARYGRWFNCPTNLEPDERVWLSFAGIGGSGQISLNSHTLQDVTTDHHAVAVDLTDHLQPRNRVEIELAFDPATTVEQGGVYGEIAIMIECESDDVTPGD
ncbi:MAG TPA: hypothetical protein VM165_22520 [Planctomycetaceae bacterium]|nr:hypothetical protein [Planctomycetaceae bacterium]